MERPRTLRRAGREVAFDAEDGASLLEVVRGPLGIASATRGCRNGLCGSCRVMVDGVLRNACTMTMADLEDGADVVGFEDIALEPAAVAAVSAFTVERPTRCTLCIPGLAVTAAALAREPAGLTPERIDKTLQTAACMCTGRGSLRRALEAAMKPPAGGRHA
jgi:aerobic-type carbon monoxide dehydrogenase small subunit (CoxS/CutS family)